MRFPSGEASIAVVLPCLDEEDAIAGLVGEILAQQVDAVIVVDNGSKDRTAERARAAGAQVVLQPERGYGRACAAGLAAVPSHIDIVCYMDGDGSDVPAFIPVVARPIAENTADFVMGSRVRGRREPGSMTVQQIVAGRLAGVLLRLAYGVRFTDMSPFRAMRLDRMRALNMTEQTYGWNLEMQMKLAAAGLRVLEVPVDHRRRRGGVSKVSGNFVAGTQAAWKIASTFVRLLSSQRKAAPR